ncbi:alpha/beta hydrolase-fold protein [Intestinirhabdus alba]|jgi:enterochelin esterase-like enzyme|uniref:DUF3327 domain-containing protein n=1 Tax=Intestinirhabdus alba TaxID=2899544 RepID=A0A6L6IN34_9ENTR|nr:alpha/beta hydrolase-fold protein [Intestinirhabdus alba]MTH48272.1 DUF3327 domain-containing protein [Intestinirhabdus alba]
MRCFRFFILIAVNLLLLPCTLAQTPAALSAERSEWRGHFNERGQAQAQLQLATGSYVHGSVSGAAVLNVQRASGEHLRQLLVSELPVTRADWQFVVEDPTPLRMALSGPSGGAFTLTLNRVLPPAQQIARQESDLSPTIRHLRQQLSQGQSSASFWQQIAQRGGTPLTEESDANNVIVTFLWRGAKHNVFILGAPSGDHDPMFRLADSDVWYRSYLLPKQTLMTYRLAPDVPRIDAPPAQQRRAILATAQQDPLNPRVFPQAGIDRFQTSSMFALADAPVTDAALLQPGDSGRYVRQETFISQALGNRRRITLYDPPLSGGQSRKIAILFDGAQYQERVAAIPLVHNLIAAGRLPPLTLVLIDNIDPETRSRELPPNEAFGRFLAQELMPWLQQRGIRAPASEVTIAGSSYGGLAATWAAFNHPEWFGNVLSMSGSFWWAPEGNKPEWLSEQFAVAPRKAITFYLEAGLFETQGAGGGLLNNSRHFRHVLLAKGYPVYYTERASGHDYLSWQTGLAQGLIQLYGKP